MSEIENTDERADPYGIRRWGSNYFTILDNGNIGLIKPAVKDCKPMDLVELLNDLDDRGITSPILLRVTSYLEHQIKQINESFAKAIEENSYQNVYRGVYPIKVNQQAEVIDQVVNSGRRYNYGLEIGSKPELVVALSKSLGDDSLLICNGIKDAEFIQLALLSLKLGFNTILVLESPRELDLVIEQSEILGIRPKLGVRIKLTNRVGGKWSESSGDRSSFGMTSDQVIAMVDKLKAIDMLDTLILQHSHLGSQIPDIIDVRKAISEACRFFVELRREGVNLTHLDLGGGLGVDYTGEHRSTRNSINYTIEEYCTNVVETVKYAMDEAQEPHPRLVTESGRATVAFSSMLIFNILEVTHFDSDTETPLEPSDHHSLSDLAAVTTYLRPDRLQECLNDANYYRSELRSLFSYGQISLRQMARGERIYLHAVGKIKQMAQESDELSDEIEESLESLADIYHCNFSLFQSLPDVWAIDQVHPIAPLQRLNEVPDRKAILADITCDSDGRIDNFVLEEGLSSTLPVHSIAENENYYLGVFYVGAYQETLGDLHNLFGDTNVVTIELDGEGGYELVHEVDGDTISEVLSYVEYQPQRLFDDFRKIVENAVKRGNLSMKERRSVINAYKESTSGYTYYESI